MTLTGVPAGTMDRSPRVYRDVSLSDRPAGCRQLPESVDRLADHDMARDVPGDSQRLGRGQSAASRLAPDSPVLAERLRKQARMLVWLAHDLGSWPAGAGEGGVSVGEHPAVRGRQPVAVPVRGRGDTDHRERRDQVFPPFIVLAIPAQPVQPVLPSTHPWSAVTKLAADTPNPEGSGLSPVDGGMMDVSKPIGVVALTVGCDGKPAVVATSRQPG